MHVLFLFFFINLLTNEACDVTFAIYVRLMSEGDSKVQWFRVLLDAKVRSSQKSSMVMPKSDGLNTN